MVLAVLATGEIVDNGDFASSAPLEITATPSRLAPSYSGRSDLPLAQFDSGGPKDDRFVALMTSLANRGSFPRGSRNTMITAAHQVCAMVAAGRSVTDASAALRVGYGFTDAQAQGVGATGVEVYCPEARP